MKQIQLNTTGYDPFLDFLKGFCILSVICNHCLGPQKDMLLFPYWGQLAVPLFLLLQVFHVFKRPYSPLNRQAWGKMLRRVMIPFLVVTLIEFILYALFKSDSLLSLAKGTLLRGGIGPGSYYAWIYLQFFVPLPLVYWFTSKYKVNNILWGGVFCA